ncbi:MAG: exodeoxyribonuclease VII small subunit [Lachnospiraceae bacterium]|nr:exodeoxyribonuclease VII small subunit [Lachnospiraceae bacterium]
MDNNALNNEFQIEEAFKRLQEINQKLESSEVSLKDSLGLYSEGVKLVEQCRAYLTEVEQEIQVLNDV